MYHRVKLHSITLGNILHPLLFTATNSSTLSHSDSVIVLYHFPKAVYQGGVFCMRRISTKAISYLFMCLVKGKRTKTVTDILVLTQKCYSKRFLSLV